MIQTAGIDPQEKLREIVYCLQNDLRNWQNRDELIRFVLGNFSDIQPITQARSRGASIGSINLASPNGIGGATSSKAYNIIFDMGKLMRVLGDKGTDFIGASPIGVIITAVKLCAQIYGLRNISIEERYAITLVALWEQRSIFNGLVYYDNLLNRVNKKFKEASRTPLTSYELNTILSRLHDLRCIQMNPNGTIEPKEQIINGI